MTTEQKTLTAAQKKVLADSYIGTDMPETVVLNYINETGEEELKNIEEAYSGQFNSDEDFARDMAENLDHVNKENQWPLYCIDWEYAARELMMDYFEIDGYFFRSLCFPTSSIQTSVRPR